MTAIWASLLLALSASPGGGKVRVCIAPFTGGPGTFSVRDQVSEAVCAVAQCVPPKKIVVRGRPSWARAKAQGVRYVVTGKVTPNGRFLELEVFQVPGRSILVRDVPVERGRVEIDSFDGVRFAMLRAMGLPTVPGEKATEKVPTTENAPTQVTVATHPTGEQASTSADTSAGMSTGMTGTSAGMNAGTNAARAPEPAPRIRPAAPAPAATPAAYNGRPAWSVEVGTDLLSRRLGYVQLTSGSLNPYRMDFIPKPAFRAEYAPLANSDGFLSGLKVGLGVSFARLLSSLGTGPTYGTTYFRFDLDAAIDIPAGEAALGPMLGFRRESFGAEPASNGSTLPGFPGVAYFGALAGVRGEMRAGPFTLFGRAAFLWNFDSGEIVSASYFRSGSSLGGDLALGAAVPVLLPRLELRATAGLTWYALSFSAAATDPYIGSGASDAFFGAGMSLRYAF